MTPLRGSIWEKIPAFISSKIYKYFLFLSPNTITIFSGIFGLLGLFIIFQNKIQHSIHLGTFLLFLFLILDFIDGDVARKTGKQSQIGAWLDPFFDKLIEGIILITAGHFMISEDASTKNFLLVTFSIVFFQLNQFSLVMDRIIKTQDAKPVRHEIEIDYVKIEILKHFILRNISLGHAALVITFIVLVNIGLISQISYIYFYWSLLTLIPVVLAKFKKLI